MEKQRYADFELEDYTVRVVDVSKKINMLIRDDGNAETDEPVTDITGGTVTDTSDVAVTDISDEAIMDMSDVAVTDTSDGAVTDISDESDSDISDKQDVGNEESESQHIIMFNTGLMEGNNIKKAILLSLAAGASHLQVDLKDQIISFQLRTHQIHTH